MEYYRLDIYTWPAMLGYNCQMRTTEHDTPQEAANYITTVTEPFTKAVLLKFQPGLGWEPCDPSGNTLVSKKVWPGWVGSNFGKNHPDYQNYLNDYSFLVKETARIKQQKQPNRGTISIANDLLIQRHPNLCGWANKVGMAAAELLA